MNKIIFNIQRFASVIHGNSSKDRITNTVNNSQVYGLGGDDTIENGNNNVTLIGGSGNDFLNVHGGVSTLNGGNGNDTFSFTYSNSTSLKAVIEDIDPSKDVLLINYSGTNTPKLNYSTVGNDVLLTDDKGYLNITIKGSVSLDEYYDEEGNEYIWDVLRIVNENRENNGLSPLTLSQGLMNGASTRSNEIIEYLSHTRPNGTSCFTILDNIYGHSGENIAAGQSSPSEVMTSWMNSTGHRENILSSDFTKLGVGYKYRSGTLYGNYWVQMFGGGISTKTLDKTDILNTHTTLMTNNSTKSSSALKEIVSLELTNKNGTTGNDTIKNSDDNVNIEALSGNDLIINGQWYGEKGGMSLKIHGGIGNDTITNSGSKSLLDGGSGDDLIYNGYYYYEPWGANGFLDDSYNKEYNDSNSSSNVTIEGGAGNDTINNRGNNVTISGGAGDDTITKYSLANNNVFQYSSGDGNDKIYGYNSTDTLNIINGKYTRSTVGNNVIVSVDSGTITLDGAADKIININGKINEVTPSNKTSIPSNAFTYNGHSYYIYSEVCDTWEEAKSYCESLGGHLAVINNASENTTLYNYMKSSGYDSAYFGLSDKDSEGSWEWVNNEKSTYTNWANNEPNGGTNENYTMFYYKYTNGKWNDGNFARGTVNSTLNDTATFICEWDTVIGNDNVSTLLSITNSTKSPVTVDSSIKTINASKRTTAIKISGNSLANSIKGGSGSDTLNGGKGNDTLTGGKGNDVFLYSNGDGKDVITDYTVDQDKIKITGSKISKTSVSGSDVILTVGSGNIIIKNGKGKKLSLYNNSSSLINTVIGGSSKTVTVSDSTKSPVTVSADIITIDASKRTKAIKITGNAKANTIKGGNGKDTIYGGSGNDSILGNAAADTLIGGKGNDTLNGGKGNDVFVYTKGDGNDIIIDYTTKQDKIKLTSGTINSSSLKGSDVILKIGSGSITIKNGKNKSITVVDSNNKSTSKIYGASSKNYVEKLWFENDGNFTNDEIKDITQVDMNLTNDLNYTVEKIINYDANKIFNDNKNSSFITYMKK